MEESSKHNKTCTKCGDDFVYFQEETYWDYGGSTNTKLVKCPMCGTTQAIKYEEQINPNFDERYY